MEFKWDEVIAFQSQTEKNTIIRTVALQMMTFSHSAISKIDSCERKPQFISTSSRHFSFCFNIFFTLGTEVTLVYFETLLRYTIISLIILKSSQRHFINARTGQHHFWPKTWISILQNYGHNHINYNINNHDEWQSGWRQVLRTSRTFWWVQNIS